MLEIDAFLPALIGVLGSASVGWLIAWKLGAKVDDFEDRIFGEKGYIQQYAGQIGEAIKGNFMSNIQPKSVSARMDNSLKEKLAMDLTSQANPLLALGIEQLFPQAYGYIAKHPELLPQLLSMAQPFLKNLGQGHQGGSLP